MNKNRNFSEITPEILKYTDKCIDECKIEPSLYIEHKVNRGLRDLNGRGVLTGLTEISEIISKKVIDGEEIPCEGELYYRGYNIFDLVQGFVGEKRFGFEEIIYLLVFGNLPTKEELQEFNEVLASYRSLPNSFVRDIIMKAPSEDMMNSLARSVLNLY